MARAPACWRCGPTGSTIVERPPTMATLPSRLLLYAVAASLFPLIPAPPARAQQWLPPIQKVPHLFVQTEVLGVRAGRTRSLGKGTIEASPGRPGTLTLPLDLGPSSADHPTAIEIEVTQNMAGDPKIGLTVATTVEVTSRTGEVTRVRRERIAEVEEGRSFFHQAYENAAQGTSVLLTMTPDTRIVPQVVKPSVSAPIVFMVSLSRITPHGDVPLEDNVLRTLESSPVSYAFRIARAPAAPVEAATAPSDAAADAAPPETGQKATAPAPPDARLATDEANGTADTRDAKSTKDTTAKKTKPKKMSRKEREQESLAEYRRAREAEAAAIAAGSTPAAGSATSPEMTHPTGTPPATGAAAPGSAITGAGAAPAGAASPGTEPRPAEGTGEAGPSSAPAARPLAADELELTLLPHRVESGILMVDASLRGRAPGTSGAERATLVQRTHVVTSNGSFDITVSGLGPAGTGSYKFSVQARF